MILPAKPLFRVFLHDGRTVVIGAVNALLAEKKVIADHPGSCVKTVKFVRKGRANG
ncbi:hypothetical protein [Sinorhizobium sp. BG8]|uniref:hypothetical protein n=1 Tax=Sinorhizobium sp. BG8 TaxID=2613773 RepID=UPI00193CCEE0|nr:hypothetical protein [Sinorhizobium sp. BG8]